MSHSDTLLLYFTSEISEVPVASVKDSSTGIWFNMAMIYGVVAVQRSRRISSHSQAKRTVVHIVPFNVGLTYQKVWLVKKHKKQQQQS